MMALGSGAGPGPAVEIRVLPCRCHQAAVALPHLACWPPSPSGRMRPALVLWPLLGRLDLGCGVFCGCLQNLLWLQFESRATEKAYPSSICIQIFSKEQIIFPIKIPAAFPKWPKWQRGASCSWPRVTQHGCSAEGSWLGWPSREPHPAGLCAPRGEGKALPFQGGCMQANLTENLQVWKRVSSARRCFVQGGNEAFVWVPGELVPWVQGLGGFTLETCGHPRDPVVWWSFPGQGALGALGPGVQRGSRCGSWLRSAESPPVPPAQREVLADRVAAVGAQYL